MPGTMTKTSSSSRRPGWRILLPLCALILLVAPGCVAANPFFRVTVGLWAWFSGTP